MLRHSELVFGIELLLHCALFSGFILNSSFLGRLHKMKRFGGGALAPVNEELKEWDSGEDRRQREDFSLGREEVTLRRSIEFCEFFFPMCTHPLFSYSNFNRINMTTF